MGNLVRILIITYLEYFKDTLSKIEGPASSRRSYVPGTGMSTIYHSSQKSPQVKSDINSINFDLDEDDQTSEEKVDTQIRRNWRSTLRSKGKINDARMVGQIIVPSSRAKKLRENLNITTPDSTVIGYRQQSNSSIYEDEVASMNRSVYSNLQSKIDKSRKINQFMRSPQHKKVALNSNTIEHPSQDIFTDINKIKPKGELAPLNLKNKVKIDVNQNISMNSNIAIQKSNMHTNAFLYSKIPGKPTIKKSSIVSGEQTMGNIDVKATHSTKASLHHKSTASSLIATLGQRKRDTKSVNASIYKKSTNSSNAIKYEMDASPRISTEEVSAQI